MDSKSTMFTIDVDIDNLVKTTCDLVKIASINPPGLEEAVGKYIVEFFEKSSIEVQTLPVEKGRFNVVARVPGKISSPALAFTGHMDVVPVSEKELSRWSTPPFSGETHDGFIYGRGSSDMKSGLASAMVAMAELVKRHITPCNDIYLIATVDEEDVMKGSKALLNEAFLDDIQMAVVCEPTSLKVCTAGKGRTYGNVRITGQTSHGSQGKGKNAIDFARQLLNRMEEVDFHQYENAAYGSSYWQALSIHAGVEPCVVPDGLDLKVDARLVPDHSTEKVWDEMKRVLEELEHRNPGFKGEIEVIDKREGWTLPPSNAVLLTIKDIYRRLGIPFDTTCFAGTTDGSILRRRGIECVIFGPGDLGCVHKENERVSIKELINSCKIYFELMRTS